MAFPSAPPNKKLPHLYLFSHLLLLILAMSIPLHSTALGSIFLEDDFDDGVIDPTKWNVVTSGIPAGGAVVHEIGGKIELISRGHLNTVQEFKPTDVSRIEITGTFQRQETFNYFQVLTRSDGTPGGTFGETANGVEFHINDQGDVAILHRINSGWNALAWHDSVLTNHTGVYSFRITDDGANVSFHISEISNPANSFSTSGTLSTEFSTNLITFHGRERVLGDTHLVFDDIKISAVVPEPGAIAIWCIMFALGGVALARVNR